MEWVDNSPYTYQRWYTATYQPNDITKIFVSDSFQHSALNLSFLSLSRIQPVASFDYRCTAVLAQFTVGLEWVKVPCNQDILNAYFVCEIKLRGTRKSAPLKQYRFISLPYIACPARMLQLNFSCLRGLSLPPSNSLFMEDVCNKEKMDMFQLPQYMKYMDARTKEQEFFVDFLISITHRWSTKAGEDRELGDTIIVSLPSTGVKGNTLSSGRTGMAALQLSESVFLHVKVANLSEAATDSYMYVMICSQPLAVVEMSCLPGHSACYDKTCVLSHYFCDGIPDCPDYSDEKECSHVCSSAEGSHVNMHCFKDCTPPACVCHDLYFQCHRGGCVPWSRVCDGVGDCEQREDEIYCASLIKGKEPWHDVPPWIHIVPPTSTYNCLDGPNISAAYRNDLVPDCPKQDDEQTFGEFLKRGSNLNFFSDETLCEAIDETTCVKGFKGVCYPRHLYCIHEPYRHQTALESPPNNRRVCRNGGHLANCELHTCSSHFKCPSAFCIPTYAICNGRADCPNGEDEEECTPLSCPGMLLCRHDSVCVHPYDVRSGQVKCPLSKDDKALANVVLCPVQCLCHGNAAFCEHAPDLKMPDLSPYLRLLIIRKSKISLDRVKWQGEQSFILLLEVSHCNISALKNKYFRQLQSLKELNFQHNIISYLADAVFYTLINLESLDLSYNNITQLRPGIFEGTMMLKVLKLQYNNLKSIAACAFGDLRNLKILNLSNNLLTYFGDNILCSYMLQNIEELDVSQNNFLSIDGTIHGVQSLALLNATPSQICCHVPMIPHCYPRKQFVTSSCRRLLGQNLDISFFAAAGGFLIGISSASIAWLGRSIVKTPRDRRKGNVTTLVLFIVDIFKGTHFLTLAVVDFLLRDYYGFNDDMWRGFGLCILLNATAYASMLASAFASLLTTVMRMVAIITPLNIYNISTTKFFIMMTVWTTVTLLLGYLPYSGAADSFSSKSESGLCFGLILPTPQNANRAWRLGAFVCPIALMLCISFGCQFSTAYAIARSRNYIKTQIASLLNRRPAVIRCLLPGIASLCSHIPLLTVHIATGAGVRISIPILEAVTIFTLAVHPVFNVFLYIFASPSFLAVFRSATSLR